MVVFNCSSFALSFFDKAATMEQGFASVIPNDGAWYATKNSSRWYYAICRPCYRSILTEVFL